jgi:osmotically-inducible protein OsmY
MQLQRDVLEELKWLPNVLATEIGVSAKGGVVTLTGTVQTYGQKFAAERAVERVSGVRAIADDLKVSLPHSQVRSDTDIAHAAVNALRWNTEVPDSRIQAIVRDGILTLDGEVEWQFQRNAAEEAVRYLSGVKGVIMRITVRQPKVSAIEVSKKIEEALKRNATLDAKKIAVEAEGGKVTLRGTVRSWAEREDAENVAWSAPGVTNVDDRILVGT